MTTIQRLCSVLILAVMLVGCGQKGMVQTTGRIRSEMIRGDYNGALGTLREAKKKSAYDEQDRVVYWMQEGMLLHLTGQYQASTKVLSAAERRTKELYTKSISKGIKAAFVSNAVKDYPGEDYENVLVNVVKALNFLGLGDRSGALVEARKINEKLKLYNTRYKQKNVYNQDAFAHWLMGLLFEMEGSYDDARIAYVKALQVYRSDFAPHYGMKVPSYLPEDIARAARLSQDNETLNKVRREFGPKLGQTLEELEQHGEIVLVHLNGEGPTKSDFFVTCHFKDALRFWCDAEPGEEFFTRTRIDIPPDGTVVKVAFPQLHTNGAKNPRVEMTVGDRSDTSVMALPIERIARKTLGDKMHRVWRDAIIRAITKALTSKAAGAVTKGLSSAAGADRAPAPRNRRRRRDRDPDAPRDGGTVAGMLGWLAEKGTSAVMQATEEADKRAWTTLPAQIEIARVRVRPGVHDVNVIRPRGGRQLIRGVKVAAGKRVFVTARSIP